MSATTERLRHLLAGPEMLVAPFVYDGLQAKIAERTGFQAVYMTGFGTAAARGYPDLGLLTMTEMVQNVRAIANAVNVPVICDADTGHAEGTRIVYDPTKAPLTKVLETFWKMHDPTTLNRQGADAGPQYRSAIFYETDAQREIAEKSRAAAQGMFSSPIVTEITKAGVFYPAERYHQDYYQMNKGRNPYCQIVIAPKLGKLGMDV